MEYFDQFLRYNLMLLAFRNSPVSHKKIILNDCAWPAPECCAKEVLLPEALGTPRKEK